MRFLYDRIVDFVIESILMQHHYFEIKLHMLLEQAPVLSEVQAYNALCALDKSL